MRVVYFSFGEGSGHIVMAASVFFGFRRAGVDVDFYVLSNSRFAHLAEPFFNHIYIRSQPELVFSRDRESELYLFLRELKPDVLIVDGVWLPFIPILQDFNRTMKVILFRAFPARWFTLQLPNRPSVQFNPHDYDLAVSCEPGFTYPGLADINPMIIRNRDEILPREKAREILGAKDGRKLCVVAHNGYEGEIKKIAENIAGFESAYDVKILTNEDGAGLFPLADYMNGIDYLIGGAGYNLFYEARYFGIDARLIPLERKAEDQLLRIETNSSFCFNDNGADQLVSMILQKKQA
jgi:hypothetical protein